MKICRLCNKEQAVSEFYISDGRVRNECRTCSKQRSDVWRRAHPERSKYHSDKKHQQRRQNGKARAANLKKHGLTVEQYAAMVVEQNDCCAICGDTPEGDKPLYVDHNHETGEVRGLLCNRCNVGLGFFLDEIERLEMAKQYLIKHEGDLMPIAGWKLA